MRSTFGTSTELLNVLRVMYSRLGSHLCSNGHRLVPTIRDLLDDGNSVVLVGHDVQVLKHADWVIEIGPGSRSDGGTVVATGTVDDLTRHRDSLIGPYLAGSAPVVVRERAPADAVFCLGGVHLVTAPLHTVHARSAVPPGPAHRRDRHVRVGKDHAGPGQPRARPPGSSRQRPRPHHVLTVDAPGLHKVHVVDATPIGTNVRSTVATYGGVLDDLRRAYAATDTARARGLSAADLSYNTGSLRCPRCEGHRADLPRRQFLPDVDIPCPDCAGRRYAPSAHDIRRPAAQGQALSLPDVLALTVREAASALEDLPRTRRKLGTLIDLDLGDLTLGQDTPALSGGEAPRLKLAGELGRDQSDALFVLDEPGVGLHPLDTRVLLGVLDRLCANGATVVVIEHDLDVVANADHVIDVGPGGGAAGGRIVAAGTPDGLAEATGSITAQHLQVHLGTRAENRTRARDALRWRSART